MSIRKIVLTGGPCAGKTTAMNLIKKEFERKGYKVLLVSETATELISGGLTPFTCDTNLDFQRCQMSLQQFKEQTFEQGARSMSKAKVLIVCDRGILDNKAFMTEDEFNACLQELNLNESQVRQKYDAVFHLVTAAKGASEAYTLSNNKTRTQTQTQAITIDDRNLAAWKEHPYLRVIDNKSNFEEKLDRLIQEICIFLGE